MGGIQKVDWQHKQWWTIRPERKGKKMPPHGPWDSKAKMWGALNNHYSALSYFSSEEIVRGKPVGPFTKKQQAMDAYQEFLKELRT